jgi:hypothetical protein
VPIPDIIEFVSTRPWLALSLSSAQRALLKVIYGLPLDDEETDLYHLCTGRQAAYQEGHPFSEVTVIAGRRAGKDSRIACPILLYESVFGGFESQLSTGERGVIPLVAQDERGAKVAFGYVQSYLVENALLRRMVAEELKYELRLTNRMSIVIFACTAKALRGYSIPAAVMDEAAFFRSESGATVDYEVQAAIRPAGISFPQQRLLKITTPSMKAGIVWDDFTNYFGKEDPDVLVWQASTALMNPTISEVRLAREARVDLLRYAREYDAIFADATEGAIPGPWIDAAIVEDRAMLPPVDGKRYLAAVDPSGGAADEFALCVIHVENGKFIQDLQRAWAGSRHRKVDLAATCQEIAALIKPFGLARVTGDSYAGNWAVQEFQRANVLYEPFFGGSSTEAYKQLIPYMMQERVEILDDSVLIRQLRLLERRNRIGGKPPIITHPKGSHDDRACALAFAVASLAKSLAPATDIGHYARPGWEVGAPGASPTSGDPESRRMWRELRSDAPAASFWRGTDARPRARLFG